MGSSHMETEFCLTLMNCSTASEVLLQPHDPRPWCWPALKDCLSQVLPGEPTPVLVQDLLMLPTPNTLRSKQMFSSPFQLPGALAMSEAGYFASRLKTALTPDIAGPLVPELHDIPWGYHTALSHHTILSALPVAAAPPLPPKHPASCCPQWTHQLFPLALIQLFSLHRLQVRLSYCSANCTDEDQHRGWSPLSAGGRHQSG